MTATDPTLAALHAAVLADPADDTVRLIFADALEESGEPGHAALIRHQVQLAAGPPCKAELRDRWHSTSPQRGCRRCRLRRTCRRLLITHGPRAVPGCEVVLSKRFLYSTGVAVTFERGLPGSVLCKLADWLREGRGLASRWPIARVRIADRMPSRGTVNGVGLHSWRCANADAPLSGVLAYGPSLLPWEIYWEMPGALGPYVADFASDDLADAALSAGCLKWARSEPR